MSVEVRQMKTAAEQALADTYSAAKAKLPGGTAIAERREASFRRFDGQGLPHRRVEEWKYTDLRALMREAKPLAGAPDEAAKHRAKAAGAFLGDSSARRLVFVDGSFVGELSDLTKPEPGLTIVPMGKALAEGHPLVTKYLGQVGASEDVAVALNTALMGDGAVINIAKDAAIARPIHLVFIAASEKPTACFNRSLIVAEAGAQATLIESHEGAEGADYQVNNAVELVLGERAEIDHVKICADGARALHVSTLMVELGTRATLRDLSFISGAAVLRNQLYVRFSGEHAVANLNGATLLRGRQHADTTLVVDHAGAGGTSRELFKSVLDGESHGVFQGKIIVQPGAQKTDGRMMARALLLSETAEASSKPELEIFADDVQCGHGSTAGALDRDLLFYLMARGIPRKQAESLLIESFVGEAVETVRHESVKDALMAVARSWLDARG